MAEHSKFKATHLGFLVRLTIVYTKPKFLRILLREPYILGPLRGVTFILSGKGKGKVNPRTGHEGLEGE